MKKDKGSTLIMVIVVSSILIMFSIALNTISISEAKQAMFQQKKMQAYYIARSGAVATADWITTMESEDIEKFSAMKFPFSSSPQDFGEGFFEVIIDKIDKELVISSIGKVSNGDSGYITDKVTIVLNQNNTDLFKFDSAIFSKGNTDVRGNVYIKGAIGSNSQDSDSICIRGNTKIDGTIYINPEGNENEIVSYRSGYAKPNIKKLDKVREYPIPVLPQYPEDLPDKGDIYLNYFAYKTINSDGCYNSIVIGPGATLIINAGTRDITIRTKTLNCQGSIRVVGDKNVFIYVDDSINMIGNTSIIGKAEQTRLYYRGKDKLTLHGNIDLYASLYIGAADLEITGNSFVRGDIITGGANLYYNGNNETYKGIIYAPNAKVLFHGNATIKGAVVGGNVEVSGNYDIMHDPSLENKIPIETEKGSSNGYMIKYWR
ncbi:MAG: hypothetical protein ACFWUA_10020 [Sporanaerobacter sp.]|jgi:hypothetical protein|uniref:pilus assembly PilX N-terminal domain-containing protein n=1 Tax=Sporanaerobacter sp. TaxID=2010183 RepID=UPI003A103414